MKEWGPAQHDAERRRGSRHLHRRNHADPHGQQHTNLLVSNVDQTSPSVVSLIRGLKGLYVGSGPGLADQQAYATLFGLVERQATMVALVRVFQYMTVMVLALISLIFLTKRPHKGESSLPNGR